MLKILKQFFCKHNYTIEEHVYDLYVPNSSKKCKVPIKLRVCTKCGKRKL